MNNLVEPLDYTIADITKIVEKEAKLNKWDAIKFDLNVITDNLDNLDFVVDTYACLSNTVIALMNNMWQDFEHSGICRALNITINNKETLDAIRNELIETDIDCYIFGDITNDCNGYIFMRVQFDHDNTTHLKKLKTLKIIDNVSKIDFDIIELNLFNEDWNKES
ncbi:hypothetical protein MNB_SUP05-SYMBIONT-7-577 [hydrothermal vent metagenome]|uniref:Uncharacterized protein n=1 Tax=hydrothermal vent metagenome TaxID=652676 RepID=A0A1W1E617_9ZZZZ